MITTVPRPDDEAGDDGWVASEDAALSPGIEPVLKEDPPPVPPPVKDGGIGG